MDANSGLNKKLLQLFILLVDEKEITYESFNEYIETKPSQFSKLIKEYKNMLIKLELNYTFDSVDIQNEENETLIPTKIYYQKQLYEDYSFKIDNLTDDEKKRYIYVLLYLMLRNSNMVSNTKIRDRLGLDLSRRTIDRIMNELKTIIGFNIIKDELQCYSIVYDI